MLFIAENGAYVADGRDEWLVADMERETAAPLIVQIRDIEGPASCWRAEIPPI